jgi:uncharacterized protein
MEHSLGENNMTRSEFNWSACVQSLAIYPVKSLGGVELNSLLIEPSGPSGDRRMMLVDADTGAFLTQRAFPALAKLDVRAEGPAWRISVRGDSARRCLVARDAVGELRSAKIWQDEVAVRGLGAEPDRFFSAYLGRSVQLVELADRRPIKDKYGVGLSVSLADSMPLLLTSAASLELLNQGLSSPISMARFRPNVVVDGMPAGAEFGLRGVRIGESRFRVAKPCSRCVMINIDPETGMVDEGGPVLRRLIADAPRGEAPSFGVLLIPVDGAAKVNLGDPVTAVFDL